MRRKRRRSFRRTETAASGRRSGRPCQLRQERTSRRLWAGPASPQDGAFPSRLAAASATALMRAWRLGANTSYVRLVRHSMCFGFSFQPGGGAAGMKSFFASSIIPPGTIPACAGQTWPRRS